MKPFEKDFPPELFHTVLRCLRNPIPAPGSRPPRSQLYQPHLVECMRVCKYFKRICEPLIYTDVITDSLDLLLEACQRRKAGNGRFALTKSLRIEYSDKQSHFSYKELFTLCPAGTSGAPLWALIGQTHAEYQATLGRECLQEVLGLCDCLETLSKDGISLSALFANLQTLAVDSIYRQSDGVWDWFDQAANTPQSRTWFHQSSRLFNKFVNSSRTLRHLCVRPSICPLSLQRASLASETEPSHSQTVHFSTSCGDLPIPFGSPIRWVYDGPANTDMLALVDIRESCILAGDLRRGRAGGGTHARYFVGSPTPTDAAEIDIYGSVQRGEVGHAAASGGMLASAALAAFSEGTGGGRSAEGKAAIMSVMAEDLQSVLRSEDERQDVVRWYPTENAGVCPACGADSAAGAAGTARDARK